MQSQKLQESEDTERPVTNEIKSNGSENKNKRKASDNEAESTIRKRSRAANGVPDGFFDPATQGESEAPKIQTAPANEIRIPSRPATPLKPIGETPKRPGVDEDEWAAFEADIAAAEIPSAEDAVISAPAMSAAELAAKSADETNSKRRERQEAELEGDKEDAARKLDEEFDEMQVLEERVKRMREKREALRRKDTIGDLAPEAPVPNEGQNDVDEGDDEDEEEEEYDDDDWAAFRMRG